MKENMFLFAEITQYNGIKFHDANYNSYKIEDLNLEGWTFVNSFSARVVETQLMQTVAVFERVVK